MELTQLKCFLAVARERNFTRAAKACNMTQPSLSYQIAKLEEELGEGLFLRKPKAVELTHAGRMLVEGATRMVEEQERVLDLFQRREQVMSGELRFGIIPTMAPYLLPPLLQAFRSEFPRVSINARESRTSQLLREVVAGEIEFAIVSDVDAGLLKQYSLHLTKLFEEELLLAAPPGHRLCGVEGLRPQVLSEEQLILLSEGNCLRDQTMELCSANEKESALVCEQLPTQLSMVEAGLGVAVVPEMAIRSATTVGVDYLRFGSPAPQRLIGLLKRRSGKLSSCGQEFLKRLKASLNVVS